MGKQRDREQRAFDLAYKLGQDNGMTEERAREILGKDAQTKARILDRVHGYKPDELEAIAWWMRNKTKS